MNSSRPVFLFVFWNTKTNRGVYIYLFIYLFIYFLPAMKYDKILGFYHVAPQKLMNIHWKLMVGSDDSFPFKMVPFYWTFVHFGANDEMCLGQFHRDQFPPVGWIAPKHGGEKQGNHPQNATAKFRLKGIALIVVLHLGVSKNRGTPKWMVYNGKPY